MLPSTGSTANEPSNAMYSTAPCASTPTRTMSPRRSRMLRIDLDGAAEARLRSGEHLNCRLRPGECDAGAVGLDNECGTGMEHFERCRIGRIAGERVGCA